MPVPSSIDELSPSAGSNYPSGSDAPSTLDNTVRAHAAFIAQLRDRTCPLTGVAGTNTITASASSGMVAYSTGQAFRFAAAGANTGAVTLNVNSIGAKDVQFGTTALSSGDIPSGAVVEVVYDGTRFQVVSISGRVAGNSARIGGNGTVTGNLTVGGNLNSDATYLEDGTTPVYRKLLTTTFTSSGTWTPNAATRMYEVLIVGAGGGGGGAEALSTNGQSSAGAGGGAGSRCFFTTTTIPASAAFVAGAAGTGSAGAGGNAGGTSTFIGTGVSLSVPGGSGGEVEAVSASTLTTAADSGVSNASTGGTFNMGGIAGQGGWRSSTGSSGHAYGGAGASTDYGSGGAPRSGSIASQNGSAATGYGAGGGGAINSQTTGSQPARTGGTGGGPICIVTEYA